MPKLKVKVIEAFFESFVPPFFLQLPLVSLVSLLVLLVVGVCVLLCLYVLKSAFGIALFSSLHFGDLF